MITKFLEERFIVQTGHTPQELNFRWRQLSGELDITGQRWLDVGAGTGIYSLYLALFEGAREIIAVEPSEGKGSAIEAYDQFQFAIRQLELENVKIVRNDIRRFDSQEKFDGILCIAVLHHIYVTHGNAFNDMKARTSYKTVLAQLYELLTPEGWLIIQEANRRNITHQIRKLGLPIPGYLGRMNWNTKQSPRFWIQLLKELGFINITLTYYTPYSLRRWKNLLTNNISNYITTSSYIVRAQRPV